MKRVKNEPKVESIKELAVKGFNLTLSPIPNPPYSWEEVKKAPPGVNLSFTGKIASGKTIFLADILTLPLSI